MIDPTDAQAGLERGEIVLVDVRDPKAFAEAHPAGAINIPINELEERLDELPDDATIITSCGGGTRGPRAAALLTDLGRDAHTMQGGLRSWRAAGLDVE